MKFSLVIPKTAKSAKIFLLGYTVLYFVNSVQLQFSDNYSLMDTFLTDKSMDDTNDPSGGYPMFCEALQQSLVPYELCGW